MLQKEFEEFARAFTKECLELMFNKQQDYSKEESAFANFEEDAALIDLSRYQTWFPLFQKHVRSITKAIEISPCSPFCKTEDINHRLMDLINYCIILAGMLDEEREQSEPVDSINQKLAEAAADLTLADSCREMEEYEKENRRVTSKNNSKVNGPKGNKTPTRRNNNT